MASITSLGIGSGLDLNSILQRLVEAERAPVAQRLDLREAETQASISAFGSLKGALSEFQSITKDLSSLSDFQNRTVTSSNSAIFEVTADNTSAVGTTSINVLNLAEAHKLVTSNFATPDTVVGTGTIKIEAGGSAFNINITDGTLNGIRDTINSSAASDKVSANIITVDNGSGGTESRLVINAKGTGESGAVEITVTDDDGNNTDASGLSQLHFVAGDANNRLTQLNAATNARITVDGFTTSSATNEFSGVIAGVTITALKKSEDPVNNPPEVLTVTLDESGVKDKVASFVTTFNGLKETLNLLLDFDVATGKGGLLSGDGAVRTAESQIERILYDSVSNANGIFNNLAQLGITTGEKGRLVLDSDTLDQAIQNNFNDIGEFFAGENGLAKQLEGLLTNFLGATGIISASEDGLDATLAEISDDRLALTRRIATIEERTRQQFAVLDRLIGSLNATGSFLTEQLKNTSAIITGIRNS